ncbi:MAG: septum formation inhibitor Maf [Magnetococcales bacterium]|nr:septum formation inhibitor Maf [Magnetococcales bacterium]MBF0156181.1 septum formation inhibitor Maf [Magnetococcales bacterium]
MGLILASASPYRRELLGRLKLPFTVEVSGVDEGRLEGENPEALVLRLAREKAWAVAVRHPRELVIGSDQVAELEGEILGKPGEIAVALGQLERASGRVVTFLTGLALVQAESGREQAEVVPYRVHFRRLDRERLRRYLEREPSLDCAGSIRSEGLASALFTRLEGDDPTALMGLPLIRLTAMLEREGVMPF